jgi:hypothetical protein
MPTKEKKRNAVEVKSSNVAAEFEFLNHVPHS